ncbi:MAG: DNA (cytosine-5-)-methyltransferase [Candidatus Aureabacteria bacterium]|nr:DNA (cytosine-5-)-methyltransferase [Candidatus Auribacterota bacterium]
METFTVGSLFSGVGGICLGFKQSGFDVLWANEKDKNACITYLENFPHTLYEGKIEHLDAKQLSNVDVVTSGFPCQAFSIAGYRKGFKDHRGHLFKETMRIIDKIKPKTILLENVKNLVSHDNGRTFQIMKEMVKDHGYSFIPRVLNSMEYGNVPQNRERIYIVGFLDEEDFDPENPSDKFICSYNFSHPKPVKLTKKVSDIVAGSVSKEFYYSTFMHYNKLLEYDWDKETIGQWRRIYVRQNKKNVCPTLTANMGTGGHNVPIIKDSIDFRKLTPKECFSFQGFPKNFKLPANMANSHLYKQAGNSVTVPVIKKIAHNIKSALAKKYNLMTV